MAVNVNLITYNGKTVTPRTDGIIYDSAIGQCGIFYGCNVSVNDNTIYVTGGYGMIRGRYFEVDESSIDVTLAPTGSLLGRLYMRLDLSNTSDPLQMLVAAGSSLPDLTQEEDANYTNGTWEMELATFTVTSTGISDLVETYETIIDTFSLIKALETTIGVLNTTIGTIYNNTRTTVRNVAATEVTSLVSMGLPAGTYVVTGHSLWNTVKAGRTFIAIGTSIAGGDSMDSAQEFYAATDATPSLAMQTTRILTLEETTQIYVIGYCSKANTVASSIVRAVRIR